MRRWASAGGALLVAAAVSHAAILPSGAQVPIPEITSNPVLPPNPVAPPNPPPEEPPAEPAPVGEGEAPAAPSPEDPAAPAPAAPAPAVPGTAGRAPPAAPTARAPALKVPRILRSAPGSTSELVGILSPLADLGVPLEEALIQAAAPFPVAGLCWFSHDFLAPRFNPYPHPHMGTDIFAAEGTPVVASQPGTVAAMARTAIGGVSMWVTADDGTSFYYAHLQAFARGIRPGDRVDMGTVLGYVGRTGNAVGTPPHLHFEIHPAARDRRGRLVIAGVSVDARGVGVSRSRAVDPKPFLDAWLRQAEDRAEALVADAGARLAGLSRQVHFAKRAEDLTAGDTLERPRELLWFSVLDPVLGTIGLARQAAARVTPGGGGSVAERSLQAQREAAVRLAVEASYFRLSELVGGYAAHPGPASLLVKAEGGERAG